MFLYCAAAALLWLGLALGMKPPRHVSSLLINVGGLDREQAARLSARLRQIPGVAEAVVLAEDGVAYLKVDKHRLDQAALTALFQDLAA